MSLLYRWNRARMGRCTTFSGLLLATGICGSTLSSSPCKSDCCRRFTDIIVSDSLCLRARCRATPPCTMLPVSLCLNILTFIFCANKMTSLDWLTQACLCTSTGRRTATPLAGPRTAASFVWPASATWREKWTFTTHCAPRRSVSGDYNIRSHIALTE